MSKQPEIDRRIDAFRNGLGELLRSDEYQGEDRFFLSVGSLAVVSHVELALRRNTRSLAQASLPFMLLVAGESASGKTTLSTNWNDTLNRLGAERHPSAQDMTWSQYISMDNYYRDNSAERASYAGLGEFYRNFDVDHPRALNLALLARHMNLLSHGQGVMIPRHDIATGKSTMAATQIHPTQFIIMEGLFALTPQLTDGLADFARLQIFVDASPEVIQHRWFSRIEQMGETVNWKVPEPERPFYFERVKQAAINHIMPTKGQADIIVNGESPEEYQRLQLTHFSEMMIDTLQPL